MIDAPIGDGANTFLWIVCILIGFVAALSFMDNMKQQKSDEEGH